MKCWIALVALAALVGCSSEGNKTDTGPSGDGGADGVADAPITPDAPPPPAGELRVGSARMRIPAPLGIGTAGYGGFTQPGPRSPFAELYPATTRLHGHPELRAVAISRGVGHEAIFLRLDTVGVFQQLRQAVLQELKKRIGRSFDHALVFGGTHTHSGPGRLIGVGGVFDLIADKFLPEYYERLVKACADTVEAAINNLAPGKIGWVMARDDDAINDRRCEDGKDYKHGALPLLAVQREGKLAALVFSYPVHGTVLGIDQFSLSRDVSGAIEQAIENEVGEPILAVFFNSWGADISPGSPTVSGEQPGATQPDGYDKMERVAVHVARVVGAAVPKVVWQDKPTIALRTHRARIDREVIGYPDKAFPYPYGGVYCGQGVEADCSASTTIPTLDKQCLAFTKTFPAPNQTVLTMGELAGVYLLTFPGESGTLLGESVAAEAKTIAGGKDIAFFGYSQDYLGYSLLEDDWWQGGYEAGGALWGPKQGVYLKSQILRFASADAKGELAGGEPGPTAPFVVGNYTPYAPPTANDFGKVLTAVKATYKANEVVSWTVGGADPWLGAPLATLETEAGQPVARPSGAPLDSDGYAFYVDLAMTPKYEDDPKASARQFAWTINFPLQHTVPGWLPQLRGRYRLKVELSKPDGSKQTVTSQVFEVTDP
ncbi:MAG: neutral/alkaline non-lysosomal ceramidase N-terminal domain-containing protein [Myxococcales bacterium]|nr:neutral/alkaline non-lysosomal ceramidase N-terminal domain-containing protein [Myxococcales bacterium]